jgi:preprotein translocase subunit SecF
MTNQLKIINFMGVRHYTSALSIIAVILSLAAITINGLKFGLDFTGGTQLEVMFDRPADLDKIRAVLETEDLANPVAVLFGSDQEVMIRTQDQMKEKALQKLTAKLGEAGVVIEAIERPTREYEVFADTLVVTNTNVDSLQQKSLFSGSDYGRVEYIQRDDKTLVILEHSIDSVYLKQLITDMEQATGASIELRSSEFVGPQIGDELRDEGGLGMLAAFALVFLYVAVQFQWKFSTGAIIGLIHNVIITVGFFAFFQWDFDLNVLAAVLALIGYSINDTIVVYDRIRENFRILRKTDPHEIINISITQTLGRTLMTSASVYIVLFCLYFIAGEVLQGFAMALIIGIVAGTYSSIYIAANITAALGISKEDLMPRPKEEGEGEGGVDSMP